MTKKHDKVDKVLERVDTIMRASLKEASASTTENQFTPVALMTEIIALRAVTRVLIAAARKCGADDEALKLTKKTAKLIEGRVTIVPVSAEEVAALASTEPRKGECGCIACRLARSLRQAGLPVEEEHVPSGQVV
jgi:hypothetical protein